MKLVKVFWQDEFGLEAAEKSVFVVFGAVLAVGAMMQIAPRFKEAFAKMANALQ